MNAELKPKHASLQELNFAADELMHMSSAEQAAFIREPLADANRRWESLHHDIAKKMVVSVIMILCCLCDMVDSVSTCVYAVILLLF